MKQTTNKHKKDKYYQIDDIVVKLYLFKQILVAQRPNMKRSPRFFGPYKIVDRVGTIAYKLELPPQSWVLLSSSELLYATDDILRENKLGLFWIKWQWRKRES